MAPSQSTYIRVVRVDLALAREQNGAVHLPIACNAYDMYKVYNMILCERGTCGIYQQRVCRVRATCLGNVAGPPGPPAAARRATTTSNGLACVMIFKKKYIYKHYIFFVFSPLAACETRARRVRSPRRRLHARAAAAEIPLAADTRATHTQLAVYIYTW